MYFNCSLPSISTFTQSMRLKLIDLNNYYKNDRERQFIYCQICDCYISKEEIYEHTISKRHKYNKLFVAISQNCSDNLDTDFIVLNIDSIRCRYCETVICNNGGDDRLINHIQDTVHMKKKQDWQDEISSSSAGASTVECRLLQPLDSLITHDRIYRKSMTKAVKQLKEKKSLRVKIEQKCTPQELGVTNDVDQNNTLHYLTFSTNFKRERGEGLPECITISNETTCICTLCLIEIPKTVYNVGGHIDGKIHKQKMLGSISVCQKLEAIDMTKKSLSQGVKLLKYRMLEETIHDFSDMNILSQKNVPQHFTSSGDINTRRENGLSDCISIEEDSTRVSTACVTQIPNTRFNIDEFVFNIDDKTYEEKIPQFNEFVAQKPTSQDTTKTVPPPANIICTICGTLIVNKPKCIKQHNDGKKHKKNALEMTKTTPQKSMIQVLNESTSPPANIMCTTCKVQIVNTADCLMAHNNSKKHKRKVRKMTKTTLQKSILQVPNESMPPPANMCTTCKVTIGTTANCLKVHNDGKKHKKNVLKMTETIPRKSILQLLKELTPPPANMCTTCKVKIGTTAHCLKVHNDGKKHKKNMVRFETSTNKKLNSECVKKSTEESSSTTKKGCYMCPICFLVVPNHLKNIEAHNNGKKHKQLMFV